jgi:hypothetical protein
MAVSLPVFAIVYLVLIGEFLNDVSESEILHYLIMQHRVHRVAQSFTELSALKKVSIVGWVSGRP